MLLAVTWKAYKATKKRCPNLFCENITHSFGVVFLSHSNAYSKQNSSTKLHNFSVAVSHLKIKR